MQGSSGKKIAVGEKRRVWLGQLYLVWGMSFSQKKGIRRDQNLTAAG